MTTALVTGATGMIGRNLVERLLRAGLAVRILARPTSRVDVFQGTSVEIVAGDTHDDGLMARAVRGAAYVFHAAGYLNTGSAFNAGADYSSYERENMDLTERILKASAQESVGRFVYISSTSVYSISATLPIHEDALLEPGSLYGRTKVMAEKRVQDYQTLGLPTTIIRPCITYGRYDRHFLPAVQKLRRLPLLPLIDGGAYLQDLVYVDDVCELCWQAASAPIAAGKIYNAASDHPVQVRDIVHIYSEIAGGHVRILPISRPLLEHLSGPASQLLRLIAPALVNIVSPLGIAYLSQDVYYAMSRALAELNFRSQYDFRHGLALCEAADKKSTLH
jgi:dihydroflavonol-4-reductase